MKNLSIRWKIAIPTALFVIVAMFILSARIVSLFSDRYEDAAMASMKNEAAYHSTRVQKIFASYENIIDTLAKVFETAIENGQTDRQELCDMLEDRFKTFPQNDELQGLSALWLMIEPNALDGRDEEFQDTLGDEAGVFTPMCYVTGIEFSSFEEEYLEDYYAIPKAKGLTYFSEPYMYDGELTASFSTPMYVNGEFIGMFGLDMDASFISAILNEVQILKTGEVTLATKTGNIVYSKNVETIGEDLHSVWEKSFSDGIKEYENAMNTGATIVLQSVTDGNKQTNIFMPVTMGFFMPETWVLVISFPNKELREPVIACIQKSLVVGFISVVALIAMLMIILNTISIRPLIEISKLSSILASGDYTADIPESELRKDDEIGTTLQAYRAMIETTKDMLSGIKTIDAHLSNSGQELNMSAQKTTNQTKALTMNLEKLISETTEQSNQVDMTAEELDSILGSIKQFEETIEVQIRSVGSSSKSINEMINTIAIINSVVASLSEKYNDLMQASQIGLSKQREVESAITKIVELADKLNETNNLIEQIADQTNLLAMNAAIEAAHAGDSGKGFSVVAEEIRKLAEDSAEQTDSIRLEIKQLGEGVESIVQANKESKNSFDNIVTMIDTIDPLLTKVNASVKEEDSIGKSVISDLQQVLDMNEQVNSATKDITDSSNQIASTVEKLKSISNVVNDSIREMGVEVRTIEDVTSSVSEITNQTNEYINAMNKKIEKFKV